MSLALIVVVIVAALTWPVLGAVLVPSVLPFAVWSNAHYGFVTLVERA